MTKLGHQYQCEGCNEKFDTFLYWVGITCPKCGEWVKRID